MEHNAVYRPLTQLAQQGIATTEYMPCNRDGELELDKALEMITPDLRAVIMVHASNVSGTLMPIKEIGERCREQGVIFIVDAAQTAGNTPIDMQECHISGLSMPGITSPCSSTGTGSYAH